MNQGTMDRLITLLLVFIGAPLFAQVTRLDVVLRDADDGTPVQAAHLTLVKARANVISDADGRASLLWSGGEDTLVMSHVRYGTQRRAVPRSVGSVSIVWEIKPEVVSFPEVRITAERAERIYAHPKLNVETMHVDDAGIWVLVYDRPQLWHPQAEVGVRELLGAQLYLLDTLFRELASVALNDRPRALHGDLRGRVVLEGRDHAWIPSYENGAIAMRAIDLDTLKRGILPWTDSLAGHWLGNDRREDYPAFVHFAMEPGAGAAHSLYAVEDAHTMELFRAEYKYMDGPSKVMAMKLARDLKVDKEIIAGYMTGFHKHMYFHVPYAPLYVIADTIRIFDHERSLLVHLDERGNILRRTTLRHHLDRLWKGVLLFDRVRGEVYALNRRGPIAQLRRISLTTGEVGPVHAVQHPFPDGLQVHDGHVYYTYRDEGSDGVRALFREQLR
ncbi:MAG: hypothetical protein MUE88_03010 [Flavobacteriales bacterium]|nr:hypothetical protein [Flavobacteriales bacterium]